MNFFITIIIIGLISHESIGGTKSTTQQKLSRRASACF
jgi:hypothetical protein